ncbi:hypothetical protein [Gimesia panareensis]|uniref:hypothetical protein n=1 Tax=Gimesia panareensis TaxID=2527978 RepID=UPI00118AFA73|nr:hypothetical protein [Gimesia panareensis]QDU52949.1 hypothetical protein Pan110_53310 [Gimesia panareensis]
MDAIDFFIKILASLAGIAAPVIAWFVFNLNRQKRDDTWFRAFDELHDKFWNDPDFISVRAWIANDAAYERIEEIFKLRQNGRGNITTDQYTQLERFDRFLNFLLRANAVGERLRDRRTLWANLNFGYWVTEMKSSARPKLRDYFIEHYVKRGVILPGYSQDGSRNGGLSDSPES